MGDQLNIHSMARGLLDNVNNRRTRQARKEGGGRKSRGNNEMRLNFAAFDLFHTNREP